MPETPFLVTIDTEGDDLWARPHAVTTRNAAFLPRFQSLCERFAFRPVYLVNYEMATDPGFVAFGRDVLARGTGEIGMHLHAWNSPPLVPLTRDDARYQPYLVEYPDALMKEKIHVMTCVIEERFERRPVSHRAGRWAFDARYARMLADEGYRVDCSVTPGVDWRACRGAPEAHGGTDYRAYPAAAYRMDGDAPWRPGTGPLLEVPVTVRPGALYRCAPWLYRIPLVRRAANRLSTSLGWLSPVQPVLAAAPRRHLEIMLEVARAARAAHPGHLEFMTHSSELMPGGSPTFRTVSDIELLYEYLERLFETLRGWCRGMTLAEFHAVFPTAAAAAPATAPVPPLAATGPTP